MAFIRERGKASNEELREHLGVSRRSVVRYLDALEREGIVVQAEGMRAGAWYTG